MTDEHLTPNQQFNARKSAMADANRPSAIGKRHAQGGRSARENLADLLDDNRPLEYGDFAVAARRTRRSQEELLRDTPSDGVLTAVGSVNSHLFSADNSATALIVNDYTVLAGTQGYFHHKKIDRLLAVAERRQLPIIMFTEGGGGRPGDTDVLVTMGGLNVPTFYHWAALSGRVPRIAVNHGYCFAGNAALFGAADVRIATRNSWIGMAGPAMIESGGLGSYQATEIGPVDAHLKTGVVDILADDEAHATALAKAVLSYVQGTIAQFSVGNQALLRSMLPDNRRMVFDVRRVLTQVVDQGSLLELRAGFGRSLLTGFARLAGKPTAILANDCRHLGGAIDNEAARKACDFYRLAQRWQLPLVSFVDTPGFMVGPHSEAGGAPGVMSDLFVAGAHFDQPLATIFLRRGYGLGAMAMAGGSFERPLISASWPQGEFGAMGLEGAVQLGFKQELAAAPEGPEREALYQQLLNTLYERGQATEAASYLEIDTVIDPIDTRQTILMAFNDL